MPKHTIQVSALMRFIIENRFEDSYIFLQRNYNGDDEIHIRDPKNKHKYAVLDLNNNSILYHNTINFYEQEMPTPSCCT